MAILIYSSLQTPEDNLRNLLSAQKEAGSTAALPNGQEPLAVLLAKSVFNITQSGAGYQPLNAALTDYADAADAAARRQLINAAAQLPVVELGNITGAVEIDADDGTEQNAAATGNITLDVANGSDWSEVNLFVVASGGARTLGLNSNVKIPSDSAISFPVTIESGKGCRVKFENHGGTWMIMSLVKSYTI